MDEWNIGKQQKNNYPSKYITMHRKINNPAAKEFKGSTIYQMHNEKNHVLIKCRNDT